MVSAIALLGGCLLVGCAGDKKSTAGGTSADAPSAVPVTIPGTDVVVLLLDAMRTSDAVQLARLTSYTSVACTTDSASPPADAPLCREGEDNATKVDALATLSCDGRWVRPELVAGEYTTAMAGGPKLFALYVAKQANGTFGSTLGVEQVVVMRTGTGSDGSSDGFALHTKNGRVVMLQTPCHAFSELVSPDIVGFYLVDPTKLASPTAG